MADFGSEKEINIIRGKMLAGPGHVKKKELWQFLCYVNFLESLVAEVEDEAPDFFGTEGWRHRCGWD